MPPRPARARRLRPAHGARARRQRVQPPRARGGRLRADGRAADRARPLALRPAALAGRAAALRRRPHERALRGPHHPEQEDRRPRPHASPSSRSGCGRTAACCWWATTAASSATSTGCRSWCASCGVDEVVFTGQVDDDELYAYYRLADVFLCLSEHEGFCVPLQEAMHFGLPVVAYDAGAVRETLRGGGLLLQDKSPELVAELLDRVTHGGDLRRAVLASQATGDRRDPGDRLRRAAAGAAEAGAGGRAGVRLRTGTERRRSGTALRNGRSRPSRIRVDGIPQVRIDQWVPALHRGDAIGDSARLMRDAFRSWGHEADVYALDARRRPRGRRPAVLGVGGRAAPGDVVDPPLRAALAAHRRLPRAPRPARAAPPQHHARPSSSPAGTTSMARICRVGPRGAGDAAPGTATSASPTASSTGGSSRRSGSRAPASCRSASTSRATASRRTRSCAGMLEDGRTNLLFVGRLAPNKKPEDLVRLASYWKRFVSPDVRLCSSGSCPGAGGVLRRAAGARLRGGLHPGGGRLHRPRRARRAPRLLRGGAASSSR